VLDCTTIYCCRYQCFDLLLQHLCITKWQCQWSQLSSNVYSKLFQVHHPHWLFQQYSSSKLLHEYLCHSFVCASEPWV